MQRLAGAVELLGFVQHEFLRVGLELLWGPGDAGSHDGLAAGYLKQQEVFSVIHGRIRHPLPWVGGLHVAFRVERPASWQARRHGRRLKQPLGHQLLYQFPVGLVPAVTVPGGVIVPLAIVHGPEKPGRGDFV